MPDFSQRFVIVYKKFMELAASKGEPTSKLALSRFLNVSQGCMQNWERGKIPQPDDLIAMHEKLGFSFDWLLTGKGEPSEENRDVDIAGLQAEIEALRRELAQADRINRQLTARLLLDGVGDKGAAINTDKAAEGG